MRTLKGWRAAGEELGARDTGNKELELLQLPKENNFCSAAPLSAVPVVLDVLQGQYEDKLEK